MKRNQPSLIKVFATFIIPLSKHCQVNGLPYAVNLICSAGKIWVDVCPITIQQKQVGNSVAPLWVL